MYEQEGGRVSSVASPRRMAADREGRSLAHAPGVANPASASAVAALLLEYFRARLGVSSLGYAEEPFEFTDGWETYSYRFQLHSPDPLPPIFAQPLTVRIYSGPPGLPRARQEILVQRHLYQLDYPVAEPLFLEESCASFGGPFLVMARVCGPTLLRAMVRRPWRIFRAPIQMAEAHARLHRLPTRGFPAPLGCLLTRRLDDMANLVGAYGLHGLRLGLDWLFANRPGPPADPRILHLDFHPMNLIEDKNRSLIVLDWNEADLGDPHADVGTTVMLMSCMSGGKPTIRDRLSILTGRFFFLRWYLQAYSRRLPLDANKLCYYRAMAAFRRLCNYGRWLHDGPQSTGNKPSLLQHLTPDHRHTLQRYFQKCTGVSVRL